MAHFTTYKINDELEAEVLFYSDCCYVLEQGTLLNVVTKAAWCGKCRWVVVAESVPEIDEIEKEYQELNDPKGQFKGVFSVGRIEELRLQNRLRLDWRRIRKSPARCLDCEGVDIVHLAFDDEPHEIRGVRIQKIAWGHASMDHDVRRRMTPEGLLIETDDPLHNVKLLDT